MTSSEETNYEKRGGMGTRWSARRDDFLEERIDDKLQAPETIPPPPCGASPDVSPTESDIERATQLKQEATQAADSGDLETAIKLPDVCACYCLPSALLYARRAEFPSPVAAAHCCAGRLQPSAGPEPPIRQR